MCGYFGNCEGVLVICGCFCNFGCSGNCVGVWVIVGAFLVNVWGVLVIVRVFGNVCVFW